MVAVAVVLAAHLVVTYQRVGALDGVIVAIDALLAAAALVAVLTHVQALTRERRRAEVLRLLATTFSVPRSITGTAHAGVALLVAAGFAEAGIAAVARIEGELGGLEAIGNTTTLASAGTAGFPNRTDGRPDHHQDDEWSPPDLPGSAIRELSVGQEFIEGDSWLAPLRPELGERPWVARIPAESIEEQLGALVLVARSGSALRDRGLLALIGALFAAALDHARLYQAAFEQARDLEAQDGRRREFLNAIAHELRTPLTSIRAFAELLAEERGRARRGRRTDDEAELLHSLTRAADRLNELVDDLLRLGRMEEIEETVDLEAVDLVASLQLAESILRPAFMQREQELTAELAQDPMWVRAEARTLEHILINVLSNANRHSPAGGEVTLRTFIEDGVVRLEVQDSGPGIDPADRERIFEPFYRVRRAGAAEVPGSGLGLAVARRAAEQLGGRIWVEGDTGARFCLELQALDPAQIPAPPVEPDDPPEGQPDPGPQLALDLAGEATADR